MKMKVSLDPEAVKAFFVDHTEKIVFAGVVACFGLIVYGAVARETFEKEPEDLVTAAQSAQRHIEEGEFVPPEFRPYAEIARTNAQPIDLPPYRWEKAIDEPPAPTKPPRGIPPVLNVRGLRAEAGRAAVNISGTVLGTGGRRQQQSGVRGLRYVVLTGLVPIQEQFFAYEDYFRERKQYDRGRDVPTYYWYAVERAEVEPGQDLDEAEFVPFDTRKSLAVARQWATTGAEAATAA